MTEMADVDHTHPESDDSFGDAFRRGVAVAVDGGERDPEESESTSATMADVDHTPTEGVSRSFERGTEGRFDSV